MQTLKCPIYDQGDSRWGSKVMLPGSLQMHNWGCLVTALTMGLHNYEINLDPGQVLEKLIPAGGFTNESGLVHSGVEKAFPSVRVYERIFTTADTSNTQNQKKTVEFVIVQAKRLISYGQPVIIHVDAVKNDGVPDHFVLAVAWDDMAQDFIINDPGWGDQIQFSKRYRSPITGIKGIMVILGTPSSFAGNASATERDIGVAIGKLVQAQKQPAVMKQMVGETIDSFVR